MVRGLSAGGNRIRTSGTAEDAGLVADLYAHNASRRIPQKGVRIRQSFACAALRREWWARRRPVRSVSDPPGTDSKRAGWRRSGAILFAFFGVVCFEPDGFSCSRRGDPRWGSPGKVGSGEFGILFAHHCLPLPTKSPF